MWWHFVLYVLGFFGAAGSFTHLYSLSSGDGTISRGQALATVVIALFWPISFPLLGLGALYKMAADIPPYANIKVRDE